MLAIVLLLVSSVVSAKAACDYEMKNIKFNTCSGKPYKELSLTGVSAKFTDNCYIQVFACAVINEDLNDITVDYKASKGTMPLTKDSKKVCGMKLFDKTIDCPLKKGTKICSTEKWIKEVPKGALSMAVGTILGEGLAKSSAGNFCYKGSADVVKKKK